MKLKNTSEKVISIGSTVVMPDGVITITKEQSETPAIKAFVKQGFVSVEDESPAADKEQKAAEPPKTDGTPDNAEQPVETDTAAGKKAKK